MSIIGTLIEKRMHPGRIDEGWLAGLGYRKTASGVHVDDRTALTLTSVYSCVRILAESSAMLPLILYKQRPDRGKDRAVDHPLFPLLRDLPNPEMTSMELRETMMGHLALRGNAFVEIEADARGRVKGLWPLRPDRVWVQRLNEWLGTDPQPGVDNPLVYLVTLPSGEQVKLRQDQVMHVRGLGYNGVIGYSPIALAREMLGLGLALQEFGARFFGNGALPGLVLTHPGTLKDTARDNIRKSWNSIHQGLDNSHRIAILEEGLSVVKIGVAPDEAQFLESKKLSKRDVADLWRVPPHMVGDLESGASYASIEQMSLEFVIYTLMPWFVRIEQAISRDVLLPRERGAYFASHLMLGLLRGDQKSRYEAYHMARQDGWMNGDDIRELEDMNPMPDGAGQVYWAPLNMVDAKQLSEQDTPSSQPSPSQVEGAGSRSHTTLPQNDIRANDIRVKEERARNVAKGRLRLAKNFERVFLDAAGRVVRREVADVRRAIPKYYGQRDAGQFVTWLETFYREHREFWKRQMLPILLTYANSVGVSVGEEIGVDDLDSEKIRQFIDDYATTLAASESQSSLLQLRRLLEDAIAANEDPVPILEQRLDEWDEKRPGKVADHETRNSLGAFALAFYAASKIVSRTRWVTMGESCPFCVSLNGKTCSLDEAFLAKGEELQGEGADVLTRRTDIRHPPIHGGCDCMAVADL
jgi:HK97 family phage portal protein